MNCHGFIKTIKEPPHHTVPDRQLKSLFTARRKTGSGQRITKAAILCNYGDGLLLSCISRYKPWVPLSDSSAITPRGLSSHTDGMPVILFKNPDYLIHKIVGILVKTYIYINYFSGKTSEISTSIPLKKELIENLISSAE